MAQSYKTHRMNWHKRQRLPGQVYWTTEHIWPASDWKGVGYLEYKRLQPNWQIIYVICLIFAHQLSSPPVFTQYDRDDNLGLTHRKLMPKITTKHNDPKACRLATVNNSINTISIYRKEFATKGCHRGLYRCPTALEFLS